MLSIALWVSCFVAQPAVEPPNFTVADEELRGYLIEAAENNPAIHMRYNEWQAALERIPQAESLDDPVFSYGQFIQSDINRLKFTIAQKFPWFGTLQTRADKASAEAEAAFHRLNSVRNRVYADVKSAYFEYEFLHQSIIVTTAHGEVVRFTEEIVRSKYSLGLAKEDELLRVQIEQATVEDRLGSLLHLRPARSARLSEALGRTRTTDLPWPTSTARPTPAPPVDEVLARTHQTNPDLRTLDHLIESRSRQIDLARKKGFPDMTIGLDYTSVSRPRQIRPDRPYPSALHGGRRLLTGTSAGVGGTLTDLYSVGFADEPISYRSGGRDNIMISLRMNLPIWRKRIKASVEEARLLEKAAQNKKHRVSLSLESAVHMAVHDMQNAERRYNLYEDSLLPKAQQTYHSLQSAYASGDLNANFLDLLDSVRLLLDFELEQLRSSRDHQIAAANLEMLVGGPWLALKEPEAAHNSKD